MKLVKIGRQGKRIVEYAMQDQASFNDLLKMCNERIGPDDQLEINGNTQPLDRCDQNALLVNGTTIIIVNRPRENMFKIKVGRVGERLNEYDAVVGWTAKRIMDSGPLKRNADEHLFLKKANDSSYDENITTREHTYIPIAGDILVLEKIRNPEYIKLYDFIHWLNLEWNIGNDNFELISAVNQYLEG